jgi:hypothetical protein
MTVTIPASDAVSTQMNGVITKLTAEIASNTSQAMVASFTRSKINAQFQLVSHLLGSGHLSAASILANEVYVNQPISDGT